MHLDPTPRVTPPPTLTTRRSAPPPAPGESLDDRLRVTRHLGAGGECDVFAGWDRTYASTVAVKIPREGDLDTAIARIRAESAALAGVHHRHLVRLFDTRVTRDRCFLVLEALDPESLAQRASRRRLAPAEAVRVVAEIAGALDALHRGGWAHRDVKAENVLFGFDGRAVLTDLGLARERGSSTVPWSRSRGTPAYMAPEIINEEPPRFEDWFAADQYALAVTAYLALTGTLPFLGATITATLFAHLAVTPDAPSARRSELAPFDAAILRALAKDPADRFASVADFAAALRAAAP